jgi:uncharacterized protein
MYSLPQEIEVWYIIPSIRRKLAKILVNKHKLKQNQVAKILGTTEAAISQYLSKKRGQEIKFPEKMEHEFNKSAEIIIKDNKEAMSEILKLLETAKQQGIACCMCKKYNKGILDLCSCKPNLEVRK